MSAILARTGTRDDWPLLLDSFWRTYRDSPHARGAPTKLLIGKMEALLLAPDWQYVVACVRDAPTEIIGMLVYRPGVPQRVAWLHVKQTFRRKGVAKALLRHAKLLGGEVECAFLDPDTAKLAREKGYTLRFRPYLPDVAMWEQAKALVDGGSLADSRA